MRLWKRLKTNDDFDKWVEFIEHPAAPDVYAIKIKKGTFKDLIYCYGKVNFSFRDSDKEFLTLQFESFVIENPRNHNVQSKKFQKFAGDVLSFYLRSEEGQAQYTTDYVAGGDDVIIEEE